MILSTYIFELGINTIVNQFINNLDGLIYKNPKFANTLFISTFIAINKTIKFYSWKSKQQLEKLY